MWHFFVNLTFSQRNPHQTSNSIDIVSGSGPASNVTANTAVSGGSGSKDQVDFVSIHHFPEEIQTDLIQVDSI